MSNYTDPFTKEDRELLSEISGSVSALSQNFQDIPEGHPVAKTCKGFIAAYNELCSLALK